MYPDYTQRERERDSRTVTLTTKIGERDRGREPKKKLTITNYLNLNTSYLSSPNKDSHSLGTYYIWTYIYLGEESSLSLLSVVER